MWLSSLTYAQTLAIRDRAALVWWERLQAVDDGADFSSSDVEFTDAVRAVVHLPLHPMGPCRPEAGGSGRVCECPPTRFARMDGTDAHTVRSPGMDAFLDTDGAWVAVLGCPALLASGPTHAAATARMHDDLASYRGTAHTLVGDDETGAAATEEDVETGLREIIAYAEQHGLDIDRGRREFQAEEERLDDLLSESL
ncbi:hypothetical protein ACFU99_04700 [Streptomyces sp. NPDC057654]|uniref:hypothetical protein n=1 Tax=Streptomyces sp. NPDC057654 TaxID=3346196 RepID=UPI0036CB6EBD